MTGLFLTYRTQDWLRLAGLALLYAALAGISLDFATVLGIITLVWLPSGLTLAALLLGGYKYWPGIFAGAYIASVVADNSFPVSLSIAAGNTLEPLLGAWLLRRDDRFNLSLARYRDYLRLVLLAGIVSPAVSALCGVGALFVTGLLAQQMILHSLLSWWMGNMLGVIVVAPAILVWRRWPRDWLARRRAAELAALLGLSFLSGQIIFLGWFHETLGLHAQAFMMLIWIAWGALRFGNHGVLLLLGMTLTQALLGVAKGVGFFAHDLTETGMVAFWLYFTELAAVGMTLATSVSELRQSEESLREQKNLLSAVLENEPECVKLMSASGELVQMNPAGLAMLEVDSIDDAKRVGLWEFILPSHRDAFAKFHNRVCNGHPGTLEFPVKGKKGTIRWLETHATPMQYGQGQPTGLLGVARDITKRKQAEESLRESERRFTALMNNLPAMVYRCKNDPDWTMEFISDWCCIITGYRAEDLCGNRTVSYAQLIHPDDRQQVWAEVQAGIQAHRPFHMSYRIHTAQGQIRWVSEQGAGVFGADGELLALEGVVLDITDKKRKDELIWAQANYDELTSLPNRRLFHDRLTQEIVKAQRTGLPLAMLLIDLDQFKEINDTLGHAKGDVMLVETARRIRECVRESDTIARLGGDEFTVILPGFSGRGQIERIAQHIIQRLSEPFYLGDDEAGYYVSASIGIALYPDDASDIETLLKNADQAMYKAKEEGRHRFSYFTESMQYRAREKLALTLDLRGALVRGELQIYYQPIVELASGRIVKAEALLRWKHPERGMIDPAIFISLAEESGLITGMGEWVFQQATASVARWRERFGRIIAISLNISPAQLEQRHKSSWPEILANLGLPRNSVIAEITEGLLLRQSQWVKQQLLEFRNNGIGISIDDFGTGFSSLSYLKQFEIDYLKIDRSFITNLAVDKSDRALTESIIMMAHKLNIQTIAEGVETIEQRELLASFGCDYAQGYLYSPAVPEEEFENMIALNRPMLSESS